MNYVIIPGLRERRHIGPIETFSGERIIDVVCDHFKMPKEQLLKKGRKRERVYARQIAMYVMRKYSKLTLREIKDTITHQNHTSPIHGSKKIEDLMTMYAYVRKDVNEIIENL